MPDEPIIITVEDEEPHPRKIPKPPTKYLAIFLDADGEWTYAVRSVKTNKVMKSGPTALEVSVLMDQIEADDELAKLDRVIEPRGVL